MSGSDVKDGFAVRGSGRACAALPWTGRHPAEVTHHACLGHSRRSRVRARHTTSTRPFIHRGANIIARAWRSDAVRYRPLLRVIVLHIGHTQGYVRSVPGMKQAVTEQLPVPYSLCRALREDARRHRAGGVGVGGIGVPPVPGLEVLT